MKNTLLSKTVKKIFFLEKKPISVPEIQEILMKKELVPNKTSLYRLLKKLKEIGLVEEILLNSKTIYYEIKTHHHHHFTCTECEKVKCIKDDDLEKEIHKLEDSLSQKGFSIANHNFSLTGKCLQCNS